MRRTEKATVENKRVHAIDLIRAPLGQDLVAAANDMSPVSGYTHNFYRYPARFSPKLVRAAINAFSKPGDLVV